MAIRIEFPGMTVTLREMNRHERIASMDLMEESNSADENDTKRQRSMIERAEGILVGMVESVDRGGVVTSGEEARAAVSEAGWLLTEGARWLRAITFRVAGQIVGGNGDLGSRGPELRESPEAQGQPAA